MTCLTSEYFNAGGGEAPTHLILLSGNAKNRPKMLIASTRRPPIASIAIIVCTHSYKIAWPAFLLPSVFVATCENPQLPY